MADAKSKSDAPQGYKRDVRTEGAGSAIIQIILGIALVAGGLFAYKTFVGEKKRVHDLVKEAQEASKGDDAPALLTAKAKYEEAGVENLEKDDKAIANMAELTAQLYQAYGMMDMKAEAQRWVSLAEERDINKAERFAAKAYILLGDNQAQAAEMVVSDLEKKGVRHPKLLHAMALALLDQGRAREAQTAADEAQKLSTTMVRLPVTFGDTLLAQGNYASARNAYEKAKALNPGHLKARTAIILSQAVAREGSMKLHHKELDKLRTEAAEINGGNPPPRPVAFIEYVDGEVYMSDGKAKEALAQAEKALAADPNLIDAIALKARALGAMDKVNEAIAAMQEAMAKVPTSIPYATAGFEMLLRAGKEKEGVALLEGVQKANPENARIYPILSVAQARAGKTKEAKENADKAIEKLGNAHPDAIFAVARALQAEGKYEEATAKYNEAMQEKGTQTWPEVFFEMGNVRMAEKDYAMAATLFANAISQWEKATANVFTIADGYDRWADAMAGQGGKKNEKEADSLRDKAKKLRSGKKK